MNKRESVAVNSMAKGQSVVAEAMDIRECVAAKAIWGSSEATPMGTGGVAATVIGCRRCITAEVWMQGAQPQGQYECRGPYSSQTYRCC